MATLTETHKLFIVQQLACFLTPQETVEALKTKHMVEIDRSHVFYYERNNPKLADKWKKIFDATRARFLTEITDIPVANQAYRLRELHEIYQTQKRAKLQNVNAMKETLEQAAKESGGMFTNRRELTGANGKPVEFDVTNKTELIEREATRLAHEHGTSFEQEKENLTKLVLQTVQ